MALLLRCLLELRAHTGELGHLTTEYPSVLLRSGETKHNITQHANMLSAAQLVNLDVKTCLVAGGVGYSQFNQVPGLPITKNNHSTDGSSGDSSMTLATDRTNSQVS